MNNINIINPTDEVTLEDVKSFENEMSIKACLISNSIEQLEKMVEDKEWYINVIQILYCIISNEPALILLDRSYLEKVYAIMEVHRFDAIGREINDEIGELITLINRINSQSTEEKISMISDYIINQSEERQIEVVTQEDYCDLLKSMIYDTIIVQALVTKDLSNINDTNSDFFISTINYLLEEMPELLVYEDALDFTTEYLESINVNSTFLEKIYNRGRTKIINDTKKKIKSLKEE